MSNLMILHTSHSKYEKIQKTVPFLENWDRDLLYESGTVEMTAEQQRGEINN